MSSCQMCCFLNWSALTMTHSVLGVEQCIYISYLNCFLMKEMMKRNAGSVVAHLHGVCVCVRVCACMCVLCV